LLRLAIVVAAVLLAIALGGAAARASSTDYITNDLLCIHSHEGAWNSDTGNGYYGGLQMDYNFMEAYGGSFLRRWGTADNWPVWAQMQAGRLGYYARGWYPWPNTAWLCGLI
jgi:hypothetical protein